MMFSVQHMKSFFVDARAGVFLVVGNMQEKIVEQKSKGVSNMIFFW